MFKLPEYQQKQCLKILDKLMEKSISKPFQQNLSESFGLPEPINVYLSNPIDLLTIRSNLKNKKYTNIQDWICDVLLVFDNVLSLYMPGSPLYAMAKDLRLWFEKKVQNFPRTSNEKWLIEFNKTRQKLRNLVNSYPKSSSNYYVPNSPNVFVSDEEELESSQPTKSHHSKTESGSSQNKSSKVSKAFVKRKSDSEDELEDDDSHSSYSHSNNTKFVIAEDPRLKEKKKTGTIDLFPDFD